MGIGQDSHKLRTGGELALGGIIVSRGYHLEADSDGDVIIHSLCNALSTAIGDGSLDTWAGEMFRSGITDSREFLKVILKKVEEQNYKISNASIMVEAGKPRLEDWREKMQNSLGKLMGIDKTQVGIAFTSGEDLTAFGRGEGIQVFSVILIEK